MTSRVERPQILGRLPANAHAVIEASAGTGKTYTLEHLVVDLLLEGSVGIEQILVVTFTEKAAGELKARLRSKLRQLADHGAEEAPPGVDAWTLDARADQRLERALVEFERATITTIHAFCQRVLMEQAFRHRRPLRQTVVDGAAAFERAFVEVLRRELAREEDTRALLDAWLSDRPLADLAALARRADERGGELTPRFELDGWRRTIDLLATTRIHFGAIRPHLVRAGVRGPRLARVQQAMARVFEQVRVAHREGPIRGLSVADRATCEALIEALEPAQGATAVAHLVAALERWRDAIVPLEAAVLQSVLPKVRDRLHRNKASRGELDFSDMLTLLDRSLDGESGAPLLAHLRERFPVALIDEFQDTDPVQWRIFERIYLGEGARGRLVVIGDPKQAIYGFRGADVTTYLRARDRLVDASGARAALDRSYRASPELVDALEVLFDPEAPSPFFPGPVQYETRIRAGDPTPRRLIEDGRPGPAAILLEPVLDDPPVPPSEAAESTARAIACEIARLLDPGRVQLAVGQTPPRRLWPHEIFVLTRSAREGRMALAALEAQGIPAALYKQEGLFRTPEAHHVRAVLAAIADPDHPGAPLAAWQTPFFAVPLEQLARCVELGPDHPLLARLLEWKVMADRRDYARLFPAVLEQSGLVERLLFAGNADRALTNYLHLFEILQTEASRGRPPLGELVYRLGAFMDGRAQPVGGADDVQRVATERPSVQIMTMHTAKGLQAEVVFAFGGLGEVSERLHAWSEAGRRWLHVGDAPPAAAATAAREETRRLAYVALTRARTRLYVPRYGEGSDARVSRLAGLQALLEPHLSRLEAQSAWAVRAIEPPPPPRPPPLPDPPPNLPPPPMERFSGRAALRADRALPFITSYSRMKAEAAGPRRGSADEDPLSELATAAAAPAPDRLPPGAASGRFLHEVLERVDLEGVDPELETWIRRPSVLELTDEALRRHRRAPRHRDHGLELVHRALTTPLDLGGERLDAGLVGAARVVRELEFLFPSPLGQSETYVKGFIDVVFEHHGRLYVLDWKSDELEEYEPAAVAAHVDAHYRLQAELYAIALARMLAIPDEPTYEARFGGAAYAFLRGLGEHTGQWFWRPRWTELVELQAQLQLKERS